MMNAEVVHDSVYNSYLLELALLDKRWRLPKRVEVNLVLIWMALSMFTVWMGKYLLDFAWIMLLISEFILFVTYAHYNHRLNRDYRAVSKAYLHALIPDACKVFPLDDLVIYERTKILVYAGAVTYYCGLRTLAQTKGESGWQVKFNRTPMGSFADMRALVSSVPQST